MTEQDKNNAHGYIEWAKHRLDEVDALIVHLEKLLAGVEKDAKEAAQKAVEDIREARDSLKTKFDMLQVDMSLLRAEARQTYESMEKEWGDIELAFHRFLAAVSEQANLFQEVVAARAKTQRAVLQAVAEDTYKRVGAGIEDAQKEYEAARKKLEAEVRQVEAFLDKTSVAGESSWKAVKAGMTDLQAAFERIAKTLQETIKRK